MEDFKVGERQISGRACAEVWRSVSRATSRAASYRCGVKVARVLLHCVTFHTLLLTPTHSPPSRYPLQRQNHFPNALLRFSPLTYHGIFSLRRKKSGQWWVIKRARGLVIRGWGRAWNVPRDQWCMSVDRLRWPSIRRWPGARLPHGPEVRCAVGEVCAKKSHGTSIISFVKMLRLFHSSFWYIA